MPDIIVNNFFVIILQLLLLNLLHFLVRICMSMLGLAYQIRDMKMCQEIALHPWIQSWIGGGWDGSIQSMGNFLYSAAIANSIMDCSTKMMEDGVVNSPPNRNVQPVAVSSPSPLRAKCATVATQDRVFPYYVPNSSIKHSKSDSKDHSQEIL
jgi:hypothetical protein